MSRKHSVAFVERPSIEFVMLADHAEAANGKLNMLGGGWTDYRRVVMPGQPPPASAFSIVVSVHTPWTETNRPLDLSIVVENDDGSELVKVETKLMTGRPPQLPPGAGQHSPLVVNAVTAFPKAGGYRVVVKLDGGRDMRTWPFRVHDLPAQQNQLAS